MTGLGNSTDTALLVLWYLGRAALFLFAALGLGALLLRKQWLNDFEDGLRRTLTVTLGLGWLGWAATFLGISGLWSLSSVCMLLVPCALFGTLVFFQDLKQARLVPRSPHRQLKRDATWICTWLLPVSCSALIALNVLIGALSPDVQQDSLWYHLSVPRAWVEWGQFLAWPEIFPSNYTLHASALYALLITLGDEIDCSLLAAAQGFLLLVTVSLFARRWFGGNSAVWAWLLCTTAYGGFVSLAPSTTGSDLAVALFQTWAFVLLLDVLGHTRKGSMPTHEGKAVVLAIAGLMMGFAMATKITALGYGLAPWLVVCMWGGVSFAQLRRPLAVATALVVVPLIPWALRSAWLGCGNPAFPLLRELVPLTLGFESLREKMAGYNSIRPIAWKSIAEALIQLPERIYFGAQARSPALIIHAVLIGGLFWKSHRMYLSLLQQPGLPQWIGVIALIQWIVFLWTTGANETVRYFAQCFPLTLVIASGGINRLQHQVAVSRSTLNLALAAITLALAGSYAARQFEWGNFRTVQWPYRPILTESDRLAYITGKPNDLVNMPTYVWLNENTPKDAVIVFAEGCYPYYLKRRYLWSDPASPPYLETLENGGVTTEEAARAWLKESGTDYMVILTPDLTEKSPVWRNVVEKVPSAPEIVYRPRN